MLVSAVSCLPRERDMEEIAKTVVVVGDVLVVVQNEMLQFGGEHGVV